MGSVRWADEGNFYIGNWVNGDREGQGIMHWPDGRTYVGNWVNNKRDGKGILTFFKNGAKYAEYNGNWVNGKRHGDGVLIIKDGPIIRGVWDNQNLYGKTIDELVEEKAKELELVLESKKMQYVELDKPISNEPDTLKKFLFDLE